MFLADRSGATIVETLLSVSIMGLIGVTILGNSVTYRECTGFIQEAIQAVDQAAPVLNRIVYGDSRFWGMRMAYRASLNIVPTGIELDDGSKLYTTDAYTAWKMEALTEPEVIAAVKEQQGFSIDEQWFEVELLLEELKYINIDLVYDGAEGFILNFSTNPALVPNPNQQIIFDPIAKTISLNGTIIATNIRLFRFIDNRPEITLIIQTGDENSEIITTQIMLRN